MKIEKSPFGKMPDGTPVDRFTLTNANGVACAIINYGVRIASIKAPDAKGNVTDVILGFDDLDGYLHNGHFACICGRFANRISNAKFSLDGTTYQLTANEGVNQLHGGKHGFDKAVWRAVEQGNGVEFSYTSRDGEEGFPGNMEVKTLVSLTDDNGLRLDYTAVTDKPTPVNLTSHGYFNLAGSGSALDHELMLAADFYTPTDAKLIPTGEIKSVKGMAMDFTTPRTIGSQMQKYPEAASGYDCNFVINGGGKNLMLAARARDPKSGRVMETWTTQPGVQLYTAIHFKGIAGRGGARYERSAGFCLETQHFPDSPNRPEFPSSILRPGEVYRHTCIYKFPKS